MGLIDVNTIKTAAQELYKIDPDIYLYGEGWSASGYHGDNASTNPGSFTANIYQYLYKQGNMCYVGGFNDGGRNALKGENVQGADFYPGWGFLSQDSSNVGVKSTYVGDMLLGKNWYVGDAYAAKQTINYASCHDNYTLFDQFTFSHQTTNGWDASLLPGAMRATTISNMVVMMSNGVAFMQGGEELFRTKMITTDEDRATTTSYEAVNINGNLISHNSYNLSDAVNAFDWSRKISVTYNGATENTDTYYAALKAAIQTRKDLKFKDRAEKDETSNYWEDGNNCTKIAWHIQSKNSSNGISSYKLCIGARYSSQTLNNADTAKVVSLGDVTLGLNDGLARMGQYSAIISKC